VIRPLVVPTQFFVWGVLVPGLFAAVGLLIVYSLYLADATIGLVPIVALVLFLIAVAVVFFPVASAARSLLDPHNTEYKVFPDRVESYGGFFIRTQRTVALDHVIDVRLSESLLQRRVGVGTVTLVMSELVTGQNGQPTRARRHFAMWNVPEPQQVYDLVRLLVRGETLGGEVTCGNCAALNDAEARFCDQCATPLCGDKPPPVESIKEA
jgi:hypothetical protein